MTTTLTMLGSGRNDKKMTQRISVVEYI